MKKLVIFDDDTQALLDGVTITSSRPITAEIDLDTLPEGEQEEIIANRRKIKVERDEAGKVTTIRLGKKNLKTQEMDNLTSGAAYNRSDPHDE